MKEVLGQANLYQRTQTSEKNQHWVKLNKQHTGAFTIDLHEYNCVNSQSENQLHAVNKNINELLKQFLTIILWRGIVIKNEM